MYNFAGGGSRPNLMPREHQGRRLYPFVVTGRNHSVAAIEIGRVHARSAHAAIAQVRARNSGLVGGLRLEATAL